MTPRRMARMAVPMMIVGAILMMVIPLPPAMLDLFLATNITLGVLILMSVVLLKDSLDFSVFPSLLLVMTMLRLALNVSSTRLILLDGYAGKVIATFGNYVVGGSVVVGLVIFLILVIIQFAVVTSGAGRVAEVAARFTLDAMPGKQMAIDADLAAGLIDEHQAREKRERIAKEAEFYGAMDGASKFVKGDAMAGVVIVMINLLGGFGIGVVSRGMPLADAISSYSLLTVGDGLVSQIPALLLSIATGLLVTRVRSEKDLGPELGRQIFGNPRALRTGAIITAGMAMLPGLPKVTFLSLAAGLYYLSTRQPIEDEEAEEAAAAAALPAVTLNPDDPEALVGAMRVEPLELHLAYDILDLIDPARGGDLLERVRALRQQIAMELGVVMPAVRTRDDVSLPPNTYRILLHGAQVASGTAPRDRALALPSGDGSELLTLRGEETVEPVFGLKAYWIALEDRATAAASGATVVDRSSVIVTHLAEVVRSNAADLLSRQHVQMLVEGLRADEPLLANDVGNDSLSMNLLHQVLRKLLEERVSVRDIGRIVEAVSARAGEVRAPEVLAGAARTALGSVIVSKIAPQGRLGVLTLDAGDEAAMHEALRDIDGVIHLALDPERIGQLQQDVTAAMARVEAGLPVALVCGQMLRRPLGRTLEGIGLDVPVLAYPELPAHLEVVPIGVIGNVQIGA